MPIREISADAIKDAVRGLILEAEFNIPDDVRASVLCHYEREETELGRFALGQILLNQTMAREERAPMCQDTGMIIIFADVGQDAHINGGFEDAIQDGAREAYRDGYLRASIVSDPLFDRRNTSDNSPAIIHTRIITGDRIHLLAMPKGFGSENMSALAMLTPADGEDGVRRFIIDTVRHAGGNPCPPIVVGVGIGGSMESCALLAKRACARPLNQRNPDARYAKLEGECLTLINGLGIGAAGFGGNATALAVNIEYAPTHIAGLPVAVNICCHACRHASLTL